MKYFLTGATGFVGGVLAKQLVEAGHMVHALVRDVSKAEELKALGVQLFTGDVTDKESMRAGMEGVDGVFHVAGWYKIGAQDKSLGEKVNVQGTRNVLELMKELQIPKGVYTSTLAVNSDTQGRVVDETYHYKGPHLSEYDRTKAQAHEVALEMIREGLPLVIVMPGLIYGPGDTSILHTNIVDFLEGRLPMLPSRFGISVSHVADIAQGHILAMERGKIGETYMLAGEIYLVSDMFKLASKLTGKKQPLLVPSFVFKLLSMLVTPLQRWLPETYTSEGLRMVAGNTYWGDQSKAQRELGFAPRPFREGWGETLRHEMNLLSSNSK